MISPESVKQPGVTEALEGESAAARPAESSTLLDVASRSIERTGLDEDIKNVWNVADEMLKLPSEIATQEFFRTCFARSLQTYGEYAAAKRAEISDYVMERSNASKVARFDSLTAQFNELLHQLHSEGLMTATEFEEWKAKAKALSDEAMLLFSESDQHQGFASRRALDNLLQA